MAPDDPRGHPGLEDRVEQALATEYRIPFRTLVIAVGLTAAGVMLFLYTYSQVATWVRDQVRLERTAIDVKRDQESVAQNREIAELQAHVSALEQSKNGVDTQLATLTTEVRGLRIDVQQAVSALQGHVTSQPSRRAP